MSSSTFTTTSTSTPLTTTTEVTGGEVACPGDSFEPNNIPVDATPIDDGEFEAVICAFDVDYYTFSVTRKTYLSVVLYLARDDGALALDLLGPEMQVIRWSSGSAELPDYPGAGVEAIHAKLSTEGTYLLRVSHYSGTAAPYSFVMQRFVDETP